MLKFFSNGFVGVQGVVALGTFSVTGPQGLVAVFFGLGRGAGVHGLQFSVAAGACHYDAFRIFRNASERFAYGAGVMLADCSSAAAIKSDSGYGVFAGLNLIFKAFRHVTKNSYRVGTLLLSVGRCAAWTCH
ncbi:hypothetical protein [Comamonas terrae]|uniref:Uncharacterized protein n=1 Tax=Comamonas terrae TaxID=673548 RepID=A0ABW5UMW5_9BURK|nr:hypothetical protein [Comamonas terrae]